MCARTFALIVKTTLFEAKCFTFFQEFIKGRNYCFSPISGNHYEYCKNGRKEENQCKSNHLNLPS